jgi:ribonuclease Y
MENNIVMIIATVLISGIIFVPIGILIRKKIAESKIGGAENEAKRLLELASKEAENIKKEEIFKAKEEIMQERNELEKEIRERRGEIQSQEKRLIQKEENLEKRATNFEHKEKELERKDKEVENKKQEAQEALDKQLEELQRISNLSTEDAKNLILSEMDKQLTVEKANIIKEQEAKAKEEAMKNAREILTYSIQKCAADHTSETTVSIVALPSDEMKGRIIGREGRNIKALETLTGIDLIIDDTPEAVVLSGFDPLRREVAKIALEKLIEDRKNSPSKN